VLVKVTEAPPLSVTSAEADIATREPARADNPIFLYLFILNSLIYVNY
jgi:hypothetical protein